MWLPGLLFLVLTGLWLEGGFLPPRAVGGAVIRVIDGDSLYVGREEMRLIGYDAPEWGQICAGASGLPWPCGLAARRRLNLLVRAGDLRCARHGTDRYRRTLAACATSAGDVGADMVRAGLAMRSRQAPLRYAREESEARSAGRGVWQAPNEHPQDYRRRP